MVSNSIFMNAFKNKKTPTVNESKCKCTGSTVKNVLKVSALGDDLPWCSGL